MAIISSKERVRSILVAQLSKRVPVKFSIHPTESCIVRRCLRDLALIPEGNVHEQEARGATLFLQV